ncbi:hypothetical protein L332_03620 [Agrococcus pavilionensis RW1]|uniref:IPT/TIG domain-containing protein n=1 Tax=Agrococcus pavilionensis RW1 TaxID=1330458 RepID=U1MS98_9MICO|nr:IPT/TIG domain-containing protein [Agrococcus pavilionensis]ERG63540.1 hypothetical protein L332_03620 [Agrococcus pavilionensis RW1]
MSTQVPLPAGATLGKSFEYGLDVNIGTSASPVWQPVRRISNFNPTPTPRTQDAQTYDDLGADNQDVTGWSFALAFNVQVNRLVSTGLYLPEIEALLARTEPDATGELATIEVRWYHKPAQGTPNPNDARQGLATVATSRVNTGPAGEIETLSVTLTGKGPAQKITNPFTGWGTTASPTVQSVLPPGEGANELVTITGSNLLGATAVTFGGTAATDFTVVSATTIVASLPAGSAGSAPVVVTTPAGPSPAAAYTRAV